MYTHLVILCSCYCNKSIQTFCIDKELVKKLKSPIDLFVVMYELTLMNEIVYRISLSKLVTLNCVTGFLLIYYKNEI